MTVIRGLPATGGQAADSTDTKKREKKGQPTFFRIPSICVIRAIRGRLLTVDG